MRRPHVYERSSPRVRRSAYHEPAVDRDGIARALAAQIIPMIAQADAAGHGRLAELLDRALLEAEQIGRA
jgi:hypothetical protein